MTEEESDAADFFHSEMDKRDFEITRLRGVVSDLTAELERVKAERDNAWENARKYWAEFFDQDRTKLKAGLERVKSQLARRTDLHDQDGKALLAERAAHEKTREELEDWKNVREVQEGSMHSLLTAERARVARLREALEDFRAPSTDDLGGFFHDCAAGCSKCDNANAALADAGGES